MKKTFLPMLIIITFFLLIQPFLHNVVSGQNQPDTIRVECLQFVRANTTFTVDVTVWNDESLGGFSVPLTFYDPLNPDVVCDSVSWSSTFWSKPPPLFYGALIDSNNKMLVFYALYLYDPWPIGENTLATLHFTTGPTWDASMAVIIDSTHWPPIQGVELVDTLSQVTPHEFISGCLLLPAVPTQTSWAQIILTAAVAGFFIFAIMMRRKVGAVK